MTEKAAECNGQTTLSSISTPLDSPNPKCVHFDETQVLSSDWASYPILGFSEAPPIEVVLINRPNAPFLGTGEASQGPTGAALANAVFDATGVRMRQIPLTPERVLAALKKA